MPRTMNRIAMLSVHTSPLAALGGKKTGGMNVYVREVARALGDCGVDVDVFTREADAAVQGQIVEMGTHARLIYLPAGPLQTLDTAAIYRHLPQFRDALLSFVHQNQLNYDLIYSHYWLSGWLALELKRLWHIPVVQMFHTLGRMKDRIAEHGQVMETPTIHLHERNIRVAVETEIMQRADRLIAATPAERIQLLWLYRANRRRIEVVPPGVDLAHFRPLNRAEARQQIGLDPDQHMLLFVGRIEPLKGLETLCQALALLKDDQGNILKNLMIQIVGGDTQDDEIRRLEALCQQLGIGDVVWFVGAREQDVLPAYYNAADALIMPSDYESFGMVALEAMACGTPVIASQVGGLAFLVEDYQTGFHVPVREPAALADRICLLLCDAALRREMGTNARRAAEDYSWGHIVEQLLQIFQQQV